MNPINPTYRVCNFFNLIPSAELKKVAANTRIRLKLMQYLLKSRQAAVTFPACIQASVQGGASGQILGWVDFDMLCCAILPC